jgi:hypothetical protein
MVMDIFLPLPDELTSVSDTSSTVSVVSELCLDPPIHVVRLCAFVQGKSNNHSLLALPPVAKNLNLQMR